MAGLFMFNGAQAHGKGKMNVASDVDKGPNQYKTTTRDAMTLGVRQLML